jgi:RNA polymerase sigma factor (sigma-70 family)
VIAPSEKEDIFNRIIATNQGRFRYIAQKYAPADEAMDLFQEIRHQLWRSLDRFEGRSNLETWAIGLALYTASVYKRDAVRRDRAMVAYGQEMQTEQRGGRDWEQMLEDFKQSISDTDRDILTLHLANLSNQEISEFIGISELNVRVKISRLKNQFKQRYL